MTVEDMQVVAAPLLQIIRRYCREAVREYTPTRQDSQPRIGHDPAHVLSKGEASTRLALRVREAAKALGVSERTLWAWTNRGEVPHIRIGTIVLHPVDSLWGWLEQQAKASTRNDIADEHP